MLSCAGSAAPPPRPPPPSSPPPPPPRPPRAPPAGVGGGGGAYDGTFDGTIGRSVAMRMLPSSWRLPYTQYGYRWSMVTRYICPIGRTMDVLPVGFSGDPKMPMPPSPVTM